MPTHEKRPVNVRRTAPASTETYAGAYERLSALAEKLKAGTPTTIDTLVEDVRAARAAHQVCARRIAAVRAEIDAELASETTGSAA